MKRINPDTLLAEDALGQQHRQSFTGVLGSGQSVECYPSLEDPEIRHQQSRVVCLTAPYRACSSCPHATFTLLFERKEESRYDIVMCPTWATASSRANGEDPVGYERSEIATCESRPYEFCSSCPSKKDLQDVYSADKTKAGWYPRYKRLREKEFDSDE